LFEEITPIGHIPVFQVIRDPVRNDLIETFLAEPTAPSVYAPGRCGKMSYRLYDPSSPQSPTPVYWSIGKKRLVVTKHGKDDEFVATGTVYDSYIEAAANVPYKFMPPKGYTSSSS